jgi:transposase-like protein
MGRDHVDWPQAYRERRTRRRFSEEFKRDAVELVRGSGKPIGAGRLGGRGVRLDAEQLGEAGARRPWRGPRPTVWWK